MSHTRSRSSLMENKSRVNFAPKSISFRSFSMLGGSRDLSAFVSAVSVVSCESTFRIGHPKLHFKRTLNRFCNSPTFKSRLYRMEVYLSIGYLVKS